jgi:hypothetical protein
VVALHQPPRAARQARDECSMRERAQAYSEPTAFRRVTSCDSLEGRAARKPRTRDR